MNTEGIILHKTLEISCRLHSGRQRTGIVISHVHSRLINICGSGKRCLLNLQHFYLLPFFCTIQRGIQSIQPRSYDQLVHLVILYCPCFLDLCFIYVLSMFYLRFIYAFSTLFLCIPAQLALLHYSMSSITVPADTAAPASPGRHNASAP